MIHYTAEQLKAVFHDATSRVCIPAAVLLEHAVVEAMGILELHRRNTFAIFCGTGTNGAYGLALARLLLSREKHVEVYLVGEEEKASALRKEQLRYFEAVGGAVHRLETLGDLEDLQEGLLRVNTLIDCMFGLGLHTELRGVYPVWIEAVNRSRVHTIAWEVPSGLDATTGALWGACVEAKETISVLAPAAGLAGKEAFSGHVHVLRGGIPSISLRAL